MPCECCCQCSHDQISVVSAVMCIDHVASIGAHVDICGVGPVWVGYTGADAGVQELSCGEA